MRIGLAASQQMRSGGNPPLARLLRDFQSYWRGHDIEIHATGGTYRDILQHNWLDREIVKPLPDGATGGFIVMASQVASQFYDAIIYLLDPHDLRTLYPETAALKRQCVVHGIPFLSTMTSAFEWLSLDWLSREQSAPSKELKQIFRAQADRFDLKQQAIALISHDANKPKMVEFAKRHASLLGQFSFRCATGTTGQQILEALQSSRGADSQPLVENSNWITRFLSGPMGGDAQIAELIVTKRCGRVIFFEDPHIARQHEADIQLLERATRLPGIECLCLNDPKSASIWAERMTMLLEEQGAIIKVKGD